MSFEQQIRAAEGYLELGMYNEALLELDQILPADQDRLESLRMRIQVLLQIRDWKAGLKLSLRAADLFPQESYGFIHAAFCLHEMGQTQEAKEKLLGGPPSMLEEPIYYYNLGCYETVLGNLDQAKAYLRASFRLNKDFREIARQDPDLAPIRDEL
jgi:tetratricopeptide (TPR) repeat protein